jgi:hypothetical protein
VIWAATAKPIKMGYKWKIGNGRKARFWEDLWFGSCNQAIQYWNIYSIVNLEGCSVREAWNNLHLRFTFKGM